MKASLGEGLGLAGGGGGLTRTQRLAWGRGWG